LALATPEGIWHRLERWPKRTREQVRQASCHAALAMLVKGPLWGHDLPAGTGCVIVFDLSREVFAIELIKLRLGVKQINVAGAALHEQGDHGFGAAKTMGCLGQGGVIFVANQSRGGQQILLAQQGGKGNAANA
jgi:hypothetical protein